jgi:hypothetical protein
MCDVGFCDTLMVYCTRHRTRMHTMSGWIVERHILIFALMMDLITLCIQCWLECVTSGVPL